MAEHEQEQNRKIQPNRLDPSEIVGIPAVRHVGKTLESDPEYNELPQREGAPQAQLTSAGGTDLTASPDIQGVADPTEGTGSIVGPGTSHRAEALKTRLPGDTSSDPHTDVGAENAATVQSRGERGGSNKS